MDEGKLLLGLREVSKLLGVSPRSVWTWADEGKFPAPLELGRLRRWRREDVISFLANKALDANGGEA